ncbi:STAS domain-containing protein [Streptomyces sp. NPDC054904]|uniref:STAS domain-containing protein n=1 Tax=unclassified Streptomyces TaxID=2593676 RepID=UPI0024820FEB|nr:MULTISPECIES: STAS domain-containing protein [unclassified Streptomyces]MDA5284013.1 STAS domain-containing protein [Streptomyces sp. Isolate_45]MDX2389090.1 STAS domain-containing protein [Streptomyces sp. DK15]
MDTQSGDARNYVETRSDGNVRIIVMAGEFDMDTVGELRTAMDPEVVGIERFVLDVSGVTFVDSTALSIMLQPALNRPVVLAGTVPSRLARLLEVTGAGRAFATAPSVAEATVVTLPPRRG